MLEHHPDIAAEGININLFVMYRNLVNDQLPIRYRFQTIDAAKQGAFTRAGGTDDYDDLALLNLKINVFEYMEVTVMLVDVAKLDQRAHPFLGLDT
jgi:hypothetical protein